MKVVATTRTTQGTGASRRLRHADKVPGILYGGKGKPVSIEIAHNPMFHSLRKEKFHASILELELDGTSERVLLRDFQMHPYKLIVLHMDFQRVTEEQKIHMRVPLHFSGVENSPAVKVSAGLVSHVLSEVEVSCLPKDLPEFIPVDLSELTAAKSIRVLDLILPAGVTAVVRGKENPVVVAVTTKGGAAEEADAATEAAAAAAEVPATAQKAPPAAAAGAPAAKTAAKSAPKKK